MTLAHSSTHRRTAPPQALSGRNVFVVEDEYVLALDLQHSLEMLGANVLGPAGSVTDALNVLKTLSDLDAAVLDLSLRGEKSFAVADELRALGVPFVFATGYDGKLVPERFAGVPVCQKPVSAASLAAAVAQILKPGS